MANRLRELTTDTAFKTFLADMLLDVRTALPGIIQAINTDGGSLVSVDVQPAIQQLVANPDGTSSTPENLAVIPGVPVVIPSGHSTGLSLTIPISIGDDCLIVMADRSIDLWQESGGTQSPVESTTPRSHELTDAICIVGLTNDLTAIGDYQFDAIEMRDSNRNNYVSVKDDGVEIKSSNSTITVNSSEVQISSGGSTATISGSQILLSIGASQIKLQSSQIDIDSPTVLVNGSPV